MLRWALLSRTYLWHDLTYTVFTTTDIPYHYYLFYTTIEPKIGKLIEELRGFYCLMNDIWWPMPITYIQQQQAGHTTYQTFKTPPLQLGNTYWFMVFPSPNPSFPASTSVIWKIVLPNVPPGATLAFEDWNTGLYPWRPKPTFNTQKANELWNS